MTWMYLQQNYKKYKYASNFKKEIPNKIYQLAVVKIIFLH